MVYSTAYATRPRGPPAASITSPNRRRSYRPMADTSVGLSLCPIPINQRYILMQVTRRSLVLTVLFLTCLTLGAKSTRVHAFLLWGRLCGIRTPIARCPATCVSGVCTVNGVNLGLCTSNGTDPILGDCNPVATGSCNMDPNTCYTGKYSCGGNGAVPCPGCPTPGGSACI